MISLNSLSAQSLALYLITDVIGWNSLSDWLEPSV